MKNGSDFGAIQQDNQKAALKNTKEYQRSLASPLSIMKNVSRLPWLITLLFSLTLVGCGSDASRIEKVLNGCAEISKQVNGRGLDVTTQAGAVADSFQAVDVSRCPQDFRIAFQQHVLAWRQAQSAYANYKLANSAESGAVAGPTKDTAAADSMAAAKRATQDINTTYIALTSIAAKYGARIPRSVVE